MSKNFNMLKLALIFTLTILINTCYSNKCSDCPEDCPYGTAPSKDQNGACICVCARNPCEDKNCPTNTTCQLKHEEKCKNSKCVIQKKAFCVPDFKTGICPVPDSIGSVEKQNCKIDFDCDGENKCCSTSTFKSCTKPCFKMACKCAQNFTTIQTINSKGCSICQCVKEEEVKTDPCVQPMKGGPCRAAFKRFYYDAESKSCKMFLYGGCQGNDNNFLTQEFCERRCIPEKFMFKKNTEKCLLEKDAGPCKAIIPKYFYNSKTQTCEQFDYGGCSGNDNKFDSVDDCKKECSSLKLDKTVQGTVCNLAIEIGPCKAALKRFAFNSNTQKCEEFTYGGCLGNKNNFETIDECNKQCGSSSELLGNVNVCSLQKEIGPCRAVFKRFFFNTITNKCEEFIYGGCEGNKNNFETLDDCSKQCDSGKLSKSNDETCNLPQEIGPCKAAFKRYSYNNKTLKCEEFTYGGCLGNKNNFETVDDCNKQCGSMLQTQAKENLCQQPTVTGPCKGSFIRYAYNPKTQKCEQFIYGGCEGNSNNFEKFEDCNKQCGSSAPVQNENDICSQPIEIGPCKAALKRFAFNIQTKTCEEFLYGGCKGTKNNFLTQEDCLQKCAPEQSTTINKKCSLNKDVGVCFGAFERFYFNANTKKCESFVYGGCGGNENNFESIVDCEKECSTVLQDKNLDSTKSPNKEVCSLPNEIGPCKAAFERFYFNLATKKCEPFIYGGCLGNENNFETSKDCEAKCLN